jgi:dienelactone hydrolase
VPLKPAGAARRDDRAGAEDAMLLAVSLLLLGTASTAPPTEAFELMIGGEPLGTEEFRRIPAPEGEAVTGTVNLKLPDTGDVRLAQDAKWAGDGHLVSYAMDVDAAGQQVTLRAHPSAAGYTMTVTAKGAGAPLKSEDVPTKPPVVLIDNNFASHLDVLTRTLQGLGAGEERAFTALVPQALQAIPATVRRGPDGTASLGGTTLPTRSYRLTIASVVTELTVRSEDGALLQAEAPMQRAILRRRGFEPVAGSGKPAGGGAAGDGREKAVVVAGPAGALPATLLMPKSATPVPAVLFLSGSGPNDKDETIGPNTPFADIARGLGDRGIASLRFDKRTFAIKDKTKLQNVQLKEEYYDDAAVALALLGSTAGIDGTRIFVLGHSEGAMVAPKVAAAFSPARGIVMMAAGVRPIDELLVEQVAFGAKLTGRTADEIADQKKEITAAFAAIRDPQRKDTPPFMGAPASYWREVIALDVPKLVRESKLPILVLQGDEDIQVSKTGDFELLRAKSGDSGGRVTYRSFAGLNHLFMKVERGSTGAEYAIPGHVDPAVASFIADWIHLH